MRWVLLSLVCWKRGRATPATITWPPLMDQTFSRKCQAGGHDALWLFSVCGAGREGCGESHEKGANECAEERKNASVNRLTNRGRCAILPLADARERKRVKYAPCLLCRYSEGSRWGTRGTRE